MMMRKEKYRIGLILRLTQFVDKQTGKRHKVMFDGDLINMASQRYQLFKIKGITCVSCGIKGEFFAKEKHLKDESYHFNLYGIDPETGEEVLITKDHIIPASSGGPDHLANYQVMCEKCNRKKGITEPDENTRRRILNECHIPARKFDFIYPY